MDALEKKVKSLVEQEYDDILIEDYIPGREYTVLVVANVNCPLRLRPRLAHRIQILKGLSQNVCAKTSELHTDVNKPPDDPDLEARLRRSGWKDIQWFWRPGYARMDFVWMIRARFSFGNQFHFARSLFRRHGRFSRLYFNNDPIGKHGFWSTSLPRVLVRHASKRKYRVRADVLHGYGIRRQKPLKKGDVIFKLEGSSQRIITKRFVEKYWSAAQLKDFRHYAYPISDKVLFCGITTLNTTTKPQLWTQHGLRWPGTS